MPRERADQVRPLFVGLRRRDVALPPEDSSAPAGQVRGHETQFDKRLQAHAEQEVVEFVDVLPVVDRVTLAVFLVDAHVVVQQAVHADVLEPDLLLDECELCLPVRAQSLVGPARADALLEDLAVGAADPGGVDGDGAGLREGDRERGQGKSEDWKLESHRKSTVWHRVRCGLRSRRAGARKRPGTSCGAARAIVRSRQALSVRRR